MVELLPSTWPQKDIYKVQRGSSGKEGSARLFPDPQHFCVLSNAVFALLRHGHHGCANACTSISIQWDWGLLDPSRIPPGSHGSSCCRAMQCPAAETPPAEKGSSAWHHIQQVLPHSPTQLSHFQAFCWFCHQTGAVLRIRVNDSYSKLLLKEVLKNLRVCVIWAILRKWKKKGLLLRTTAYFSEISYFFLCTCL